ncbi:MAG: hypothetical protein NDJ89_17705 [Oligoflexia bacterium]|nr:hypothetical protein [Oligoflexia bacterium]
MTCKRIALSTMLILGALPVVSAQAEEGLPLHGFADVGMAFSSDSAPESFRTRGATVGNFDLYLTPQFSDRTKGLFEILFEPDDGRYILDIERIQVGYTFSDLLTAWLGRFHTPYGYWNTAFHHGAQIQTSILRPRFLDFEDAGGILPAHSVGFWGTGQFRVSSDRVVYDVYITNGARILGDELDPNIQLDDNKNTALGGQVAYSFGNGPLDGFRLGFHGYTQQIDTINAGTGSVDANSITRVYGFSTVYENHGIEALGEYYRFSDRNLAAADPEKALGSWAGFVQLGYDFLPELTAYGRLEKAELDQEDAYFANQASGRSYTRESAGLRFRVGMNTALKFEFLHTNLKATDQAGFNEGRLQYAVNF